MARIIEPPMEKSKNTDGRLLLFPYKTACTVSRRTKAHNDVFLIAVHLGFTQRGARLAYAGLTAGSRGASGILRLCRMRRKGHGTEN